MEKKGGDGVFLGFFLTLFFSLGSWLCSVPAWLTLLLHFTVGLPLSWFFAAFALWILAGVIRWAVILLARRATEGKDPEKENKNPYSMKKQ